MSKILAASSWSSGKDSCFACYKAKQQGHKITSLINFTNFNGTGSVSHGLSAAIIKKQASLAGIPFLQKAMPKNGYTDEFKKLIEELKIKDDIKEIGRAHV